MVLLATFLLNVVLFISPRSQEPAANEGIQAVIALSGDTARLDRALELMDTGVAPVLIISAGEMRTDPRSVNLCADAAGSGAADYEVLCPDPVPTKTRGEAKTISAIVAERGWTKVAVVTSGYHLTRSRVLFRHCSEVEIVPVASAKPDFEVAEWWDTLVHEWGGLAQALLFRRQCG